MQPFFGVQGRPDLAINQSTQQYQSRPSLVPLLPLSLISGGKPIYFIALYPDPLSHTTAVTSLAVSTLLLG